MGGGMDAKERQDRRNQQGREAKIKFFHKTWPGVILRDGSKVKLKCEKGGFSGHLKGMICSNLNQDVRVNPGSFSIFGFTKAASGWKILLKSAAGSMPFPWGICPFFPAAPLSLRGLFPPGGSPATFSGPILPPVSGLSGCRLSLL